MSPWRAKQWFGSGTAIAYDIGSGTAIAHDVACADLTSATTAYLVGSGRTHQDSVAYCAGSEGGFPEVVEADLDL